MAAATAALRSLTVWRAVKGKSRKSDRAPTWHAGVIARVTAHWLRLRAAAATTLIGSRLSATPAGRLVGGFGAAATGLLRVYSFGCRRFHRYTHSLLLLGNAGTWPIFRVDWTDIDPPVGLDYRLSIIPSASSSLAYLFDH